VVFPGKRLTDALARLDALRRNIEGYKLRIRSRPRPAQGVGASASQAESPLFNEWISVTVSAGIAERAERQMTPEDVIRAADQALYRAKSAGRNRVSR
jgi:GGDEF domain-containing protein